MDSGGDVYQGGIDATELRLGLPGTDARRKVSEVAPRGNKRAFQGDCKSSSGCTDDLDLETAPAAKARVVGWPPVRSFRKNTLKLMKAADPESAGMFVKVSMDGAPYLRKIDLNLYNGYKELRHALNCKFNFFSSGEREYGSEFAIAYEDRDGDWMLVGDVPWEMFSSSCKKLRITKGSNAKGLGSSS